MSPAEAIDAIRGFAKANRYRLTEHAWQRLRGVGRNVLTTEEDVANALREAKTARFQAENGRWRVEGPDMDGDDLTLVVEIQDGLLVITVI